MLKGFLWSKMVGKPHNKSMFSATEICFPCKNNAVFLHPVLIHFQLTQLSTESGAGVLYDIIEGQ